jgi:hypothetical protein
MEDVGCKAEEKMVAMRRIKEVRVPLATLTKKYAPKK